MTLTILRTAGGFTLVEALVAAALVATGAVVLAQLVAVGAEQTTTTRDALEALVAAQSKLEELRATTWSYSVPGSDIALSPAGALSNDAPGFVDRTDRYVRRWAVTRRDPADSDVVVMHVCVFAAAVSGGRPEACVSTIRTRRP